jgi:hypothetical protein
VIWDLGFLPSGRGYMKLRNLICQIAACLFICALAPAALHAEIKAKTFEKPIHVEVTLTEKSQKVSGDLLRYDAEKICIKNASGEHDLKWSQLVLTSQHAVRARIVDRSSAPDLLALAELAMKCNLREQAKLDVAAAAEIDPASQLKGDAILRSGSGAAFQLTKYQQSTPEEDAKAIETARSMAAETARILKIKFVELQTPHFIIFTNWDSREFNFLKTNCEAAYSAVSKQFDIPVQQNVFVGKLPIYMLAKHAQFQKYAKLIDRSTLPDTVAGYYMSHTDASGHMVMWKPAVKSNTDAAERNWARTLTHEFTHAFMARYRTNHAVPRWLNEGLAEVVAEGQFPKPLYNYVHAVAGRKFDFQSLFNDKKMPPGEMYPVMQTMVEYLMHLDRREFYRYLNDLKDGMDPDEALLKHFVMDRAGFESHWRLYAKRLND